MILINCRLLKQRLNTKSSTEAEVFRISDYTPFNISIHPLMESQNYPLKSIVVYHYNQSEMLMERNRRDSCTGNYHHIHIRHFFETDRQDKGEFSIYYYPTWKMLANYFTNPLQGRLFNVFREIIMGWKHVIEPEISSPPPSKESVGKIYEAENANFPFNKKYYIDALIQKRRVKKGASERVIFNNLLQKGEKMTERDTKKKLTINQLFKDATQ